MSNLRLGIDIGSTTAKAVILNEKRDLLFSSYRRHNAETVQTLQEIPSLNHQYGDGGSL